MATVFKEGDRVQVVERQANADDVKSSLYFNHYRGLTGSVQKVFETSGEIVVTIDEASLPEPILTRHLDVRQQMKTKWLDGLSEEARNRLTEQEKDFILRYSILVAPADLLPSHKTLDDVKQEKEKQAQAELAAEQAALAAAAAAEAAAPRRKTAAEIEADEEEYLRTRKREEE